jgi:hypothetical protein
MGEKEGEKTIGYEYLGTEWTASQDDQGWWVGVCDEHKLTALAENIPELLCAIADIVEDWRDDVGERRGWVVMARRESLELIWLEPGNAFELQHEDRRTLASHIKGPPDSGLWCGALVRRVGGGLWKVDGTAENT